MNRIGLIVNPLAGIGGRVGLKGSDGIETQRRALELGAVPESIHRASLSLIQLLQTESTLEVVTFPREMGETSAREAGFTPKVIGEIGNSTTAEDTRRAVHEMSALGVDLILFAGGDGTARDVCSAIPAAVPVSGNPCGRENSFGGLCHQSQTCGRTGRDVSCRQGASARSRGPRPGRRSLSRRQGQHPFVWDLARAVSSAVVAEPKSAQPRIGGASGGSHRGGCR